MIPDRPDVLCIIQARLNSTRLPQKMLLDFGGETLIERAWKMACRVSGCDNVVVAIPETDESGPLGEELRRIGANIFAWDGDENDVLGRFYHCANAHRLDLGSVIVRWTPDDPFKDVPSVLRVAQLGVRLPVEIGCEAFTLAMLNHAHETFQQRHNGVSYIPMLPEREHITHALFVTFPPSPPNDGTPWSIDTPEQYEAACAWLKAKA